MVRKESHAIHMVPIETTTLQYSKNDLLSPINTMRQRGLLDTSPSLDVRLNSPFQFSSTKKRWRWWDYIAVVLALIAFIEIIVIIINAVLLSFASEPVTFSTLGFFYL